MLQIDFLRIYGAFRQGISIGSRMVCESHLLTTKSRGLRVRETADDLSVPRDQALVYQAPGRGTTSQHRNGGGHRLNGARFTNNVIPPWKRQYTTMSIMSIEIIFKIRFFPIGTFLEALWPANPEKKDPKSAHLMQRGSWFEGRKYCCPLRRRVNNALDLLASRIVRRFPQELAELFRCFEAAIEALQDVCANQMHIGKIVV
jgi:hypothetical protein